MRHATTVWLGIVALCIVATAYETPNVMRIWRHTVSAYFGHKTYVNEGDPLPDRVVTLDPEAAEVLCYASLNFIGDNKTRLGKLSAKYPDNEFFLCRRAAALGATGKEDSQTALTLVDRLIVMDPENAHYRYLRGWIIIVGPQGSERVEETFAEFERGHGLPEFQLPFSKYKERVDRLCEAAALDAWDRPTTWPFYWSVSDRLSPGRRMLSHLDPNAVVELIDSAGVMASRLVETAPDLEALECAASLLEEAEALRLRRFALPAAQARQTRWRLARAVAMQDVQDQASKRQLDLTFATVTLAGPGGLLLGILWEPLFGGKRDRSRVKKPAQKQRRWHDPKYASLLGAGAALALIAIMSDVWGPVDFLRSWAYEMTWLLWWGQIWILSTIEPRDMARGRQPRVWITGGYAFLWLNGILLLIAAPAVLGPPTGVSQTSLPLPVLVVWSVLCLLLWGLAGQQGALFGRFPRARGLFLVMCWAAALMIVHVEGANRQRAERILADPLSLCRPLPTATQETYERYIRDSKPPRYGHDLRKALPEYLAYAAPEDVEAYFASRHAQGRPLTPEELRWLLGLCGHDVRPLVQDALERSEG